MRRTPYDYSGFSLRRLNQPRFAHAKLLLTWVIYFALYFLTENLIPAESCHVVHSTLDDMIPFCEYAVIFYASWFLLVAGSLAYYFFYDPRRFAQLDLYIFVTQVIGMICYILWPSVQNLRPDVFPRQNFFSWVMSVIYAFDTPTGVCPSLHVAYSLAILSVFWHDEHIRRWFKGVLLAWVICICLSTAFVKQHSMVDVFWGIPTALAGEVIIYHTPLGKKLTGRYGVQAR